MKEVYIEPGQSFEVDIFRPADAPGTVRLYRAVYGDAYPVKTVYMPERIIEQNADGSCYNIVARTPKGDIIGQVAMYRSSPPDPMLYEWGQGLVLREYRNRNVMNQLAHYLHNALAPGLNLEQLWGEAVCNHIYMQKACASLGWHETALEIDLMPAASYEKEKSSSGRVSSLVMFFTYKPRSQTLFLPGVYDEALRFMYSAFDFGHTFAAACDGLPGNPGTAGKIDVFESAGVARITVFEIGGDFGQYLKSLEEQALNRGAVVIQVYLKLSSPWVGGAVDILRGQSYYLGGPLPRWFDDDGLLMQKTLPEPNFAGIRLHTERAQKLLDIIRKDRQAVLNRIG